MKKIVLFFVLILISKNTLGQNNIIPNALQVKSPQVSEFERQGNIPVSLYTGGINYQIPIYSSNFDISLSYNSPGFMPNKKTNYVGYNWSLNFGGLISRIVNGVVDENNRYSQPGGTLTVARTEPIHHQDVYTGNFKKWSGNTYLYMNIGGHPQELNPDKFTFNFNGHTGFFYIGTDNIPIIYSNEGKNLKIDLTNVSLRMTDTTNCFVNNSEIIITDEEGNKYFFGGDENNLEVSYNLGGNYEGATYTNGLNHYISAWYLKKIQFQNDETIEITYRKINKTQPISFLNFCNTINIVPNKSIFGENQYLYELTTYFSQQNRFESYKESGGFLLGGNGHSTYIENWPKTNYSMNNLIMPTEVKSKYFNITFQYQNFDGIGNNFGKSMLSDILIKNGNGLNVKKYKLEYYDKGEYKFLKTLKINNEEDYSFEYYNIDNLPPSNTHAIDYWGFWNGKANNNKLIPSYKIDKNTNEVTITSTEREPNTSVWNTALLKKVIYPTNGYTMFEYLPNVYSSKVTRNLSTNFLKSLYSNGLMYNAGGARIWKITSNDGEKNEIKEYKYIKGFKPNTSNQKSSGILMLDYRMAEYENYKYPGFNKHILIESGQNIFPDVISNSHITYSEVQEYINGILYKNTKFTDYATNSDNQGVSYRSEVIKNYETTQYLPAIYFDNISIKYPDLGYQRGKVLEEVFYKNGIDTVKTVSYVYNNIDYNRGYFDPMYINQIGFTSSFKKYHQYYLYNFVPHVNISTIIKEYDNTNKTFIFHNINNEWRFLGSKQTYNIKKTQSINSKGETLTTEYKYPPDLATGGNTVWDKMVERNMIGMPVRTKTSNDGTVLSEQRTVYNNFGELILPQFVYAKKGEMGQTEAVADRKITYNSYDAQGNLTQYTMENGIPVAIIWGYNGQYPIAKVEGQTYASLGSRATALITASNSSAGLTANSFNTLRTDFPNALVTGYVYQPLVGVTMIVQPNGQVEKYAYDGAGRLEEIRNHDNEILKTFQYNYAQP